MKSKNLTYALLLSIFLFNCSSDNNDDDLIPTTITYDGTIKSIINTNCTQCHGSTPSNGAPFSLTTYGQVSGRIDRIIDRTNNTANPMPPSGLMASENRALIQQWKDDGLLEN